MLSCGEASGDLYAGALARELLAIDPTITISGLAGRASPPRAESSSRITAASTRAG